MNKKNVDIKNRDYLSLVITCSAVAMSLFFLYTAATRPFTAMIMRSFLIGSTLILVFLLFPLKSSKVRWVDYILLFLSVVTMGYVFFNYEVLISRTAMPTQLDVILGILAMLVILEATRRTLGWALPVVVICFLLYAFWGEHIPGILSHAGVSLNRIIGLNYMYTEGIFGVAADAMATTVFNFILLGGFLEKLGGGEFFIRLAMSLLGSVRGGPAKISIFASALFGSISGSAVANVASTGVITIPMMRKIGYSRNFSGAVEAVASTGGQITPPIMGAAAFLMAEMLSLPYTTIIVAAILPALMYYFSIYLMIDFRAAKNNLKGLPREELPSFKNVLKEGWWHLLPLLVLVVLLFRQYSPARSAFYAIVIIVLIEIVRSLIQKQGFPYKRLINALETGTKSSLVATTAVASAGMVILVFNVTGLGIELSGYLAQLSGGNLYVLLVLAMIAALIMGMGLPTVACYLILAVMLAPALVELGMSQLSAHFFIFFFGIISSITPPIALAAYVGAGIAEGSPMKTGLIAFRLGLAAYLMPFTFALNPVLLMQGGIIDIMIGFVTTALGILALSISLEGYGVNYIGWIHRVALFISALLLVIPETVTDVTGVIILIVSISWQFFHRRKSGKLSIYL